MRGESPLPSPLPHRRGEEAPRSPRDRVQSWLSAVLLVLVFFCACAPVKQFYPDRFFAEDNIYENKALGFAVTFRGSWTVATDPAEMSKTGRKAARMLQKSGRELLFAGSTVEGTQGTRGIAENLNLANEDYLEEIRKSNAGSLEKDLGSNEFVLADRPVIAWEYQYQGFHFVEYLFASGSYNIRIAFWTKPELFLNFLPVYEEIMSTLTATRGY